MKVFTNKKKMRGYREFLYILPFIILVRYLLIIHCMDGHTRFLITNRQKHLAWMTL